MHVRPQVAARIDAGQDPRRIRHKAVQAHAHAISGGAIHGEAARSVLADADWIGGRDPVAATRQGIYRSYHHWIAKLHRGLEKGLDARRGNAVVIREKES